MASKWKYASLPAEERLQKIRSGNKDIYESEIARSVDTAKARQHLGLDVSEQRDWIDRVSYAHNAASAEKLGISPASVNKTGYADRLLGLAKTDKSQKRFVTLSNRKSRQQGIVQELNETLSKQIASAEKTREGVVEWLFNNGIDVSSDQGERFLEQADKEIAAKVESYKSAYRTALKRRLAALG